MFVAKRKNAGISEIGASVFVPVRPEVLHAEILDVRGFPRWAPGVRRVEVLDRAGMPGMVSEWEISVLGMRRRVLSVLELAEPDRLRWSYEGPILGWGECALRDRGAGTLARFETGFQAADPRVSWLMGTRLAHNTAERYLRDALSNLGGVTSGERGGVRVGPLAGI